MAILYKSNIDLGGLALQKAALHPASDAPQAPSEGQVYWNTGDDKLYVHNGSSWIDVSGDVRQIDAGTGISVSGGSGGTATVSLSHLGIESLGAPESDAILFYDTSASASKWLSPSSSSGIEISGTTLQLSSIPNASLANSSLTVTAGNGLTDGGSISLGGSATLNVGAGTGISVAADSVALKNASNLTDTALPMWDDDGGQLTDSSITDDGTAVNIGSSSDTRNLVVSGDLTVSGTTTTVNSNEVNIGDAMILLNSDIDASTPPSEDAGIEVKRGTQANKKFYWDETNDRWRTEGKLWIGTADQQSSVTTQTKVLIQNTGTTQEVERIDIADIGTALGVGSHSILLDAVNRDNVSKTNNTYTVTHSLGSKLVNVQVVDATTYETVFVEVARTTVNAVEVRFASTVANGDYICMTSLVGALDTANIAS